ncbi:MAG: amidohydrolase [Bacteroidetes bacterium]|nr:amidohydrolase [Bacteroidota bacterium]
MQDLRITLIQSNLVWEDRDANLNHFTNKIKPLKGNTDLIVLPEMFTTGFSMNPAPNAETMQGKSVAWMAQTAAETGACIAGSLIIEEAGNYYNRLIWASPQGEILQYNKRHLFTMAGEEKVYTAGAEKLITTLHGWRICPMICYDLRFPVWVRNTEEYDVLIFVANWPAARAQHWQKLLPARAIENQCYAIGVNRIGIDGTEKPYQGDSQIINPMGEEILNLAAADDTATATLSYEALTKTRRYMPFLKDRDGFSMIV